VQSLVTALATVQRNVVVFVHRLFTAKLQGNKRSSPSTQTKGMVGGLAQW